MFCVFHFLQVWQKVTRCSKQLLEVIPSWSTRQNSRNKLVENVAIDEFIKESTDEIIIEH